MSAVFSGPMFEPAEHGHWKSSLGKGGGHYNVFGLARGSDWAEHGMAALRELFPDGEANDMNVVIFSTSGVHGTYNTIEEAEAHLALTVEQAGSEDCETSPDVTFLVIQPRIVCLRYGTCTPKNADDIAFLKRLRASSWKALKTIGK